ncbi:MAG: transposase [Cenarchaeum sp. SB0677_bin_16]|nr:transposase [Cenarchaeum sp. SB0677_bin_16]
MSVRCRQFGWVGEPNTPSFSQLCKRMNTLDVNINKGEMITVTGKKYTHTLAVDATELKQHNRGEWMGKKWKVKCDFVKMHVMVDTQTLKIIAVCITDESVGDASKFQSLLGES